MNLSRKMRKGGWLCFTLMWIPFATFMLAMLGLPTGDYAWSELPVLARFSIVIGGLLATASTLLLFGAPLVSGLTNRSILAKGQSADAVILKVMDTGTTINNNPVVRLLVEVHPPHQPPFQAETERLISRLQIPQVQPGVVVHVKYDPDTKAVAMINEDDPQLPPDQ